MSLLFWCTVWAIISYMVVKNYKEKYKEHNPEKYADEIVYAKVIKYKKKNIIKKNRFKNTYS